MMLTSVLLPRKCAQALLGVASRPLQPGRGSLHSKLASATFLIPVKLERLLLVLLVVSWPASPLRRVLFGVFHMENKMI